MNYDEILAKFASVSPKQRRRNRDEEHEIQKACVTWFRYSYPKYSHCLFSVPNGGKRDKVTAAQMKAEGALAGVSDLILLKSNRQYGALLIEMKTKIGRQSEAQKEWQKQMEKDCYRYVVCRSLDDFKKQITDYLNET